MPCFNPLLGYRSHTVNPETGKRSIVFNPREGFYDMPVTLPCGQCIGCRLEKSRQWAIRCVHEAKLYEQNCFITLTYAGNKLPRKGSLVKAHFQKFMKRLRINFPDQKIRYFHCGEYGDKKKRPHYHAILFNFDFEDRVPWKKHNGFQYYTSQTLSKIWGKGFVTVCDTSFETAAYVARYVTKKITGERAEQHYDGRIPEYATMSRRPGIGGDWYRMYKSDVFPLDEVVIRAKKMRPPKYYDLLLSKDDPSLLEKLKVRRKLKLQKHLDKNPDQRLSVREECLQLKANRLIRGYENGT